MSSAAASPPTNGGHGTKRSLEERYIPAPTWQGVKQGYYFGTGPAGTGYYLGEEDTVPQSSFHDAPQNKKARKSVQIAEDRNEIKLYSTTTSAADFLLAQAEQRQQQQQGGSKFVALTVAGVKAVAAALKKAIETNALQRAKEEDGEGCDTAALYMESEVALYEHIAVLKAFAADPATLYPVLLEQNVLSDLVQLLLHDNVDIAVAVTAVLLEWLDADLMLPPQQSDSSVSTEKVDDDNAQKRRQALTQMAASLLQHDVSDGGAELLVDNLARMMLPTTSAEEDDDNNDEVGRGVADILSLLENLLEMDSLEPQQPPLLVTTRNGSTSVAAHFCKETALVPWIFQQLGDTCTENAKGGLYRDRAMELLAYLAPREDIYTYIQDWSRIPLYTSTFQSSGDYRTKEKKDNATVDGIEILLQCVATFRKRQPASDSEVEFLENSCMVLASVLTYSSAAVQSFLDAQGIELVMRCLKERVYAAGLALKWFDFAGSELVYRRACEHLVQAGALKYIFPLFLGHNLPKYYSEATTTKQKKAKNDFHQSVESTTVRILYALIRHLREDSPDDALERVLAKFVGNSNEDNEKVNRLVDLLLAYDQRARLAEYKFFRSDVEETLLLDQNDSNESKESMIQFAALDSKLAAGGDIWHRLAVIAAFVCTGSKQCHRQVLERLHAKESGIGLVREALEEFVSVLDETSDQKEQLQNYQEHI